MVNNGDVQQQQRYDANLPQMSPSSPRSDVAASFSSSFKSSHLDSSISLLPTSSHVFGHNIKDE